MSGADNSLSSSLTDLMTSLMVIFILLLVNFLRVEQGKEKAVKNNVADLQSEIRKIIGELKDKAVEGVEVKVDENDPLTLVVIVPENAGDGELFKKNSSEPASALMSFLGAFSQPFIRLVASENWSMVIRSVIIEGHTDREPFKNDPYGNLELSQNRSKAVLQSMLETAAKNSLQEAFWALASASGRADQECRVSKTSSDLEQRKCRKVQFKIRVKSAMESTLREQLPEKGAVAANE